MPFSLTYLLDYFNDDLKQVKKGDNHFNPNDVISLFIQDNVLRGHVKASFKRKVSYQVMVSRAKFHISLQ